MEIPVRRTKEYREFGSRYSFVFMEKLRKKLAKSQMNSSILLGSSKLLNYSYRNSSTYNDSSYFPFYYHLGTQLSCKTVLQCGTQMGLIAASFLQGCNTVENWTAIDEYDENISVSIIESNIKQYNSGNTTYGYFTSRLLPIGPSEKFDVCFLTEKYTKENTLEYLELLWDCLEWEGLLVVDYINDDAVKGVFHNFCRVKNRTPEVFETRYGVGILMR